MARIAVGGFHHETNTFAPTRAETVDFETPDAWPGLTEGPALFDVFRGLNIPISGFLAGAQAAGHDLVPLLWCSAGPSAQVKRDAYERVAAMILDRLEAAGPVDAVYLCLHGAMVAEHLDDGEGEILKRVRALVGDKIPIVASLDFHANVTDAMVRYADAFTSYRSYPHLDMAETGQRAAALLDRRLKAKTWSIAHRKIPFLIPLTFQCTLIEPAKSLYAGLAARETAGVASVAFTSGFPLADIPECGPAAIACGEDAAAVSKAVDDLARAIEAKEPEFAGKLWQPAEAVRYAIARAKTAHRPVVLADTQDNPGAGANSDTVGVLAELVKQGAEGAVLGLLFDPDTAAAAHAAGRGATLARGIGAVSCMTGHAPFQGSFTVEALSDGAFEATGPFYAGNTLRLGPMAVLKIGGVRVVVSSRKQQLADQAMLSHLGIEPARQKIIALKSSVHFRADFEPIAEEVLVVEAPGPNIADPRKLPYRHLRKGLRLGPLGPAFGD
ncbi:MAG: M81 family metallopeptidase [Candidatus Eiseniibacteriota bacterium]